MVYNKPRSSPSDLGPSHLHRSARICGQRTIYLNLLLYDPEEGLCAIRYNHLHPLRANQHKIDFWAAEDAFVGNPENGADVNLHYAKCMGEWYKRACEKRQTILGQPTETGISLPMIPLGSQQGTNYIRLFHLAQVDLGRVSQSVLMDVCPHGTPEIRALNRLPTEDELATAGREVFDWAARKIKFYQELL